MVNMVDKRKIYKNLRYFSVFLLILGVGSIIYGIKLLGRPVDINLVFSNSLSGIILTIFGLICLFLEHIDKKIKTFRQDKQL